MSCNKLIFWPGYCQHLAAKHFNRELIPASKKLAPTQKLNKLIVIKLHLKPHAEPHVESSLAPTKKMTLKYIVPAKQTKVILKAILEAIPEAFLKANRSVKLLELAMVGAALFQYFTKQNDMEAFTISMQDFKYQLNKTEKLVTDLATVVPECYHEFLDVFLKKNLK